MRELLWYNFNSNYIADNGNQRFFWETLVFSTMGLLFFKILKDILISSLRVPNRL